MNSVQIVVVSREDSFVAAVRDLLAAQLSAATCESLSDVNLRSRPHASALVVDGRDGPDRGPEVARRARAMGFAGGIALVGDSTVAQSSELGVTPIAPDRLAHDLVPALVAALEKAGLPLADQVMRARRLVAAGETALHLQHDINNPLAALLAELQLMQMDALAPQHVEAVERMLALCYRLIAITRRLDGVGERKA